MNCDQGKSARILSGRRMKSNMLLDYAVFQLSPKRARCELFVSSDGETEKLASGLVKPFVTHLKVVEEQVALSVQSIKLEVEKRRIAEAWFTKGTIERFVRFVSTPEILELVNTLDAEMSQLEAARKLYSQGAGDQLSGTGGGGSAVTATSDATKKELFRAIDVRLSAVKQDLATAFARAASAGFSLDTVTELQMFASQFRAHRLNEACSKFILLCEKRPDLISPWKGGASDRAFLSSYSSDISIDEDPTSPGQPFAGSNPQNHSQSVNAGQAANITQTFVSHQEKPSSISFPLHRSRESSIEEEDMSKEDESAVEKEKKHNSSSDKADSVPTSQQVRRSLSVQDRISLFENKQKESFGSGGKPVVGKSVELRRQSSDVPEKAVLKRWSGANDMSIDLTGDKKDVEEPLCTPSSAPAFQAKSDVKKGLYLSHSVCSGKSDYKAVPGTILISDSRDQAGMQSHFEMSTSGKEILETKQLTSSFSKSADSSKGIQSISCSSSAEIDAHWNTQTKFYVNRTEDNKDQEISGAQFQSSSSANTENFDSSNPGIFKGLPSGKELTKIRGSEKPETQIAELKDRGTTQTQPQAFRSKGDETRSGADSQQAGSFKFSNQKEELGNRNLLHSQSYIVLPHWAVVDSGQSHCSSAPRSQVSFGSQLKSPECDSPSSLSKGRSLVGGSEEARKEDFASLTLAGSSGANTEDSKPKKHNFERQVSDQVKRVPGHSADSDLAQGNSKTVFSSRILPQALEVLDSFSMPPASLVQRAMHPKGNQRINDELKVKANELEKLFAQHKLRVPGESSSTRRSQAADMPSESAAYSSYQTPVVHAAPAQLPDHYRLAEPAKGSSYIGNFSASSLMKSVENQNSGDALSNHFSELNFSEGSRGKHYETYMQKRNEKMKGESSSRRVEKEAKLKAMHDSFDRSVAEMKAKFSGPTDRQDSASTARRRAERLRSFSARSYWGREQQRLDFGQCDDDEDLGSFQERTISSEDRVFNDDLSRSATNKKILPSKSMSSSTPRTAVAPISRSAIKASNGSSGRRKLQSENPLTQSVPNFSEMRKENTKPSTAGTKASRPMRSYDRSKSVNEELSAVKEEKSHRSQSLRKSYANSAELRETSPANPEDVCMMPSRFDDVIEKSPYSCIQKHVETKPFLRKGSGKEFSNRTGVAKQKASMESESLNSVAEFDDIAIGTEDPKTYLNDDEEELETMGNNDQINLGIMEQRLCQESEKWEDSGSENGDIVKSFAYVDPSMVAELPAASGLDHVDDAPDSQGGSPVSWNSQARNPFPYTQEMSDVDVTADSPVGSPVSWNSHSLGQMETDAARMRKKWGTAHKPMLVTNSSNNQSRKDTTRGFKRLLKFGRKTRGSENLVDWISATTSEGDDDSEDISNRSSEDLRKSRMGLLQPQGHPVDDGFNKSEFYSEQVQSLQSSIPAPPPNFKMRDDHLSGSAIKAPKSFFSLSTFRSKGSDSKPR